MSDVIKAEDVTPGLAKSLIGWTSIVPRQARAKVAEMANAMIDAGLVSPPCWETKFTDFKVDSVFKEKDDAMRHARHFVNCEVRHWKGQTE